MKHLLYCCVMLLCTSKAISQNVSLLVGTDVPYQHYVGVNLAVSDLDISFRTGVLAPPYSDVVLETLQALGVDNLYIDLLDASFDLGWMNSLGAYYHFGAQKKWYAGAELRLDYLTAADSREDLVEAVTEQSISRAALLNRDPTVQLGVLLTGLGCRIGRLLYTSDNQKHQLKSEVSFVKYIALSSSLSGDGTNLNRINDALEDQLWQDVFKPYGYLGGIGFVYSYNF